MARRGGAVVGAGPDAAGTRAPVSPPPRPGRNHLRHLGHGRAVGGPGAPYPARRRVGAHPTRRGARDLQRRRGYAGLSGNPLPRQVFGTRPDRGAHRRALAHAQAAHGVSRVNPAVLLLGTFDTKGEEYAFVREAILARGLAVVTMDLGVLGTGRTPRFPVDISAEPGGTAGRGGAGGGGCLGGR